MGESETETGRDWETSNDVLTIEKTIENPEQTPTLVTFNIISTAEEPLSFRLIDALPDAVPITITGFHPEYKFEEWTLYGNGEIAFSDVIAPGETLFAFYYLQDDISTFLAEVEPPIIAGINPTIPKALESDQPPVWRNSSASIVSKETIEDGPLPDLLQSMSTDEPSTNSSELTEIPESKDEKSGNMAPLADLRDEIKQSSPETDDLNTTDADVDTEAVFAELKAEFDQTEYEDFSDEVEQYYPSDVSFEEMVDPDDAEIPTGHNSQLKSNHSAQSNTDSTGTDTLDRALSDDTAEAKESESILAALLQDLEEYDLSKEERAALAEKFGLTTPQHTSVKVRHLQSEVADLTAYIDALEEFLDDNGTAAELLGTLEDDLDNVQSHLDRLETTVDDNAQCQDTAIERIEAIEQDIEAIPEIRDELTQIRGKTEKNSNRLDEVQENLTRLVDQMNSSIKRLEDAISNNQDKIRSLHKAVSRVEEQYERICDIFRSTASQFSSVSHTDDDE